MLVKLLVPKIGLVSDSLNYFDKKPLLINEPSRIRSKDKSYFINDRCVLFPESSRTRLLDNRFV